MLNKLVSNFQRAISYQFSVLSSLAKSGLRVCANLFVSNRCKFRRSFSVLPISFLLSNVSDYKVGRYHNKYYSSSAFYNAQSYVQVKFCECHNFTSESRKTDENLIIA